MLVSLKSGSGGDGFEWSHACFKWYSGSRNSHATECMNDESRMLRLHRHVFTAAHVHVCMCVCVCIYFRWCQVECCVKLSLANIEGMISNYTRIEIAGISNEKPIFKLFYSYKVQLAISGNHTKRKINSFVHRSCNLIKYIQHISALPEIHLNVFNSNTFCTFKHSILRTLQSNNTLAPMFTEKNCKFFGVLSVCFSSPTLKYAN